MEQTGPKSKPVDSERQPSLIPPEPERSTPPSLDHETLKQLGDENQAELRKQREEADRKDHWSDV